MKSAKQEESAFGFKDKQKALNMLKSLDGRDISYQYHVILTFIGRAKRTIQITRDEQKLTNLREALKIFEDWLADYKERNRGKENLAYLPIETIESFRCLAQKYDVWDDEFFEAYKRENGDYKALRAVKTTEEDTTWDIERNKRLKDIIGRIKSENIQWYETDVGDFRGLPTKEHTQCIVLGYSPDPSKLKKLTADVRKKFDEDDAEETEEKGRDRKRSHRDGSSSRSDDDSNNSEPKKKKRTEEMEVEKNQQSEKAENALGFKDKENALRSIELLKNRDVSYQFHAISGLVKRAARVISCTKDEKKIENMREAVEVLENWITDYNVNGRSKENFNYLGIDVVRAFQPLAERYDVEDNGFFGVYEEAGGDYKKLRSVRVAESDVTWDVKRNEELRELVNHIKEDHIQWFDTDAKFRGLPTAEHTRCIMWGFSPDAAKLKKLLPTINEKLKPSNE